MTDQWTLRLSEYLDGELTASEREEMDRHLAECDACRATLVELGRVVARAAALDERQPKADLWPAVGAAIAGGRVVDLESRKKSRRFSFSLPQLVAAAAALVMISGGGAWLALSGHGEKPVAVSPPPTNPTIQRVSTFDPHGRADSAITELQRILDNERGNLDSTTVRVLTQNLALIDRAIDQARKALESDPGNSYLSEHLARTMRKKIEVLRRAADLAAVQS
jgi:hypothetical protein